jgi:hypothetical protein
VCAEASIKAAAAFAHPPRRETEQEPVAWTDRELQLIDGMIEVQLHHAAQCDAIANRPMAERQKGWDMERVALLRKIKSISPRREPEQEQEQEPVAWLTEDSDRVVTQKTKSQMLRDGGAASSSMAPYCVPAFSTPPRRDTEQAEPVANNPDPYHLSRILHELAGSASMCWEHVDRAGVFQSTQAADFVAAAIAEIRQRMKDAPPRREWRGLTMQEINALPEIGGVMWRMGTAPAMVRAIRAVERALKEKNS